MTTAPTATTAADTTAAPDREPLSPDEAAVGLTDHLPAMLATADPVAWERALLSVAAQHDVDERGRCQVCVASQPSGPWWHRRRGEACPTRRVMSVEVWSALDSRGGQQ